MHYFLFINGHDLRAWVRVSERKRGKIGNNCSRVRSFQEGGSVFCKHFLHMNHPEFVWWTAIKQIFRDLTMVKFINVNILFWKSRKFRCKYSVRNFKETFKLNILWDRLTCQYISFGIPKSYFKNPEISGLALMTKLLNF